MCLIVLLRQRGLNRAYWEFDEFIWLLRVSGGCVNVTCLM